MKKNVRENFVGFHHFQFNSSNSQLYHVKYVLLPLFFPSIQHVGRDTNSVVCPFFFQRLLPLRYKIRSYCHGQSGNQFSKRVENGKQIVSFVMICRRILFSFCLTLVQCLSLFHIYFFRLAIVNRFYGKFSDCTDWFSFLHNWRNNNQTHSIRYIENPVQIAAVRIETVAVVDIFGDGFVKYLPAIWTTALQSIISAFIPLGKLGKQFKTVNHFRHILLAGSILLSLPFKCVRYSSQYILDKIEIP